MVNIQEIYRESKILFILSFKRFSYITILIIILILLKKYLLNNKGGLTVSKLLRLSMLALLLVMCMSVSVAAEVTDDTTSDVTMPDVETNEETVADVDTGCGCDCGGSCDITTPTIDVTTTNTVPIEDINDLSQNDNTTYDFSGTFTNVNINYTNLNNVVFTSTNNDAIFINSTIALSGTNITVSNLKFNNTNTTGNPLTITDSSNVLIDNNEFNVYKNVQEETYSINVINSENVVVTNNTLNMNGAPQGLDWTAGGVVKFSGIVFTNVNNSYIDTNVLNLVNSTQAVMWDYSTMEAITVRSGSQNDVIRRNVIYITGSDYIYGISTSQLSNNLTICNNNITMTGTNLVSGIQLASTTNSCVCSNKIIGTCTATSGSTTSGEAFAYGITVLTTTWHPEASEATGNCICSNNVTLNSTVAYAYELSIADNTTICNNYANVTGNVVMALGIYNSSYNNITANTFYVTGNTTELYDYIYEAVWPVTTGIKINETSNYNNITNNYVNVYDFADDYPYTIILEDANYSNVLNNTLRSVTVSDYLTIYNNGVGNNIPDPQI